MSSSSRAGTYLRQRQAQVFRLTGRRNPAVRAWREKRFTVLGVESTLLCLAGKALYRARRENLSTVLGVKSASPCSAWKALYRAWREKHATVLGVKSTPRC